MLALWMYFWNEQTWLESPAPPEVIAAQVTPLGGGDFFPRHLARALSVAQGIRASERSGSS